MNTELLIDVTYLERVEYGLFNCISSHRNIGNNCCFLGIRNNYEKNRETG